MALHRLEWRHPHLGEVSETACTAHERQVLAALKVLGIGCGGTIEDERQDCDRCFNTGQRPRKWLSERLR